MTWNTTNVLAVFLDCDIWVHHRYFFGNIHSFPVISPMGTSQSHDLEHCECTVHVPAGVITGKLSGKFKMYLQCSRWVHCWYTVHFLVMYLQCSWWEHHYLPPVIGEEERALMRDWRLVGRDYCDCDRIDKIDLNGEKIFFSLEGGLGASNKMRVFSL